MEKKLKKLFENKNNIILLIFFAIIAVASFFIFRPDDSDALIKEDQIRLKKGDRIVIVNKNGLVEYRSEEGVFYENWDSSQISDFFTAMEAEARAYLANPNKPKTPPPGAYEVTLWLDGKIVIIYISEDSEVFEQIEEIFKEFDKSSSGKDLSSYFDDEEDASEVGGNGTTSSLTPTPTTITSTSSTGPTPTSIPYAGQGGSSAQIPPDCDLYGSSVNKRTVISNTICKIEDTQE